MSQRGLHRLRPRSLTAVILPVPCLDGLTGPSARDAGMPAHVTLLYPFLPTRFVDSETERALGSLVLATPAFDFSLARVGRFPGVVYLAPEPAAPFRALTSALVARWPEHPPYGGAYPEVVPHLTVAHGEAVPEGLVARLPLRSQAREVWLMARALRRWTRLARFPLGASRRPS